MRSLRRWSLRAKIGGVAVSAIALFIITTAIAGIIGNQADTIFVLLWGLVGSSSTSDSWSFIVLILLIVLSAVAGLWNQTRSNLRITNQVVDLDGKLLKLVPNLISAGDLEEEMDRLIHKFLERATVVFDGEVNRASLFLPDPDRKLLRMRHSYQISHETVKRTVFDIETGKPGVKKGIAGEAFLDPLGLPHVVHIKRQIGKWVSDREGSYIFFDEDKRFLPSLQYQSCVCVPISLGETPADCLGVVCFDSQNPTVFDSAETEGSELHKRLIVLAWRFASMLVIYEKLKRSLHNRQHSATIQAQP